MGLKIFFRPFRPQFGPKITGRPAPPRAPFPGPAGYETVEENRTTLSRWTVMGIQKQLPGVSKTQGRGRGRGWGLSLFFLRIVF